MIPRLKNREIDSLTGVRALAAGWVVLDHLQGAGFTSGSSIADRFVQQFVGSGYLGVDLFFVLSGFVIAYNYWDQFTSFNWSKYGTFLWMRLARMYPVHLIALLGALTLWIGARWSSSPHPVAEGWTGAQFVQHLLLIQHWSYRPTLSWNFPSWSISCEWAAYLAFPVLVSLVKRRQSMLPVVAAILCGFLVLGAGSQFLNISATRLGLPRIAVSFSAGTAACILWRRHGAIRWGHWLVNGSAGLASGILALSLWRPGISPFWMTALFPFFVYGLACERGAISRILSSKPLVFGGKVSYSLYMTHALVIMAFSEAAPFSALPPGLGSTMARLAIYLGSIGTVAVLTYFLVEEPGRRWMRTRIQVGRPAAIAVPYPPVEVAEA